MDTVPPEWKRDPEGTLAILNTSPPRGNEGSLLRVLTGPVPEGPEGLEELPDLDPEELVTGPLEPSAT